MIITFTTTIIALIFSLFATIIISYVALATAIGPWIEITLVLLGALIFRIIAQHISTVTRIQSIALATAAGGIGGALAMACAFSFPTLYFLDQAAWNTWMQNPFSFAALLMALCFAAGGFGIVIAHIFEQRFWADTQMIFPIGQIVYDTIAIPTKSTQARQMVFGVLSTCAYNSILTFTNFIPNRLSLLSSTAWEIFEIPTIMLRTDIIPMFWAIGFITGHLIAIPLTIAVIAKFVLIAPAHLLFFNQLTSHDYILAFGTGMALQGALLGFWSMVKMMEKSRNEYKNNFFASILRYASTINSKVFLSLSFILIPIAFLTYFSFSLPAQIYLLLLTLFCTYQLLIIAGKLGIAPLGRFATFVMVPGILLFQFTSIQITLVATFVEIAGAVAVDYMFGQKVAREARIPKSKMMWYQLFGLCSSAVLIGFILFFLITHLGLGSSELVASRAQSRALLAHAFDFNLTVMTFGFLFGYALHLLHINSILVFGGLLMNLDIALILIAGGLSTYLVKNKESHYPFFSGVYATNSLWMFLRILF